MVGIEVNNERMRNSLQVIVLYSEIFIDRLILNEFAHPLLIFFIVFDFFINYTSEGYSFP